MPKRKRKKYSRPRRPFDKLRIEEENVLKEKYGLKNKKEIWKADSAISRIRDLAKHLITKSENEKQAFIEKLQKMGFKVNTIPDILTLSKEDWLKRRLQTLVFSQGLVKTPKQARQLITHKHVSIGGRIVNIPSYHVYAEEESTIQLQIVLKTTENKKKSKTEEIEEEILEGKNEEGGEDEESSLEKTSEKEELNSKEEKAEE